MRGDGSAPRVELLATGLVRRPSSRPVGGQRRREWSNGASWCGPCRKENPNIVKAYAAYRKKGFEILGVSYDNEKGAAKWKKAILDDGLTWKQVSDLQGWKNATSDQYYIKAIPSNVLLDKEGRIIAKNLFGKKLTDKLAELLP